MRKKLYSLMMASAFACSAPAFAANEVKTEEVPIALKPALDSGLTVVKHFEAEAGLKGWVLSQNKGKHVVAYTTQDGKHAIFGALLNDAGANLTEKFHEEHAPKLDTQALWKAVEGAHWVAEKPAGEVKSIAYIFKDANCTFCHLAWKALQPYQAAGMEIRWIPVAFLAESSMDKAGVLLDARDTKKPSEVDQVIDGLQDDYAKKAKKAYPKISAGNLAKVESNNALMREWGFQGTPVTIMKDAGGEVKVVEGMFRLSDIPAMSGMAAIENTDPALKRFE